MFNIIKIKVEYQLFGKNNVDTKLDKGIEKLANERGLELVGSGYYFPTKTRDLDFREPEQSNSIKL